MIAARTKVFALALAWLFAGCTSNDDAVFKSNGNTESKPVASLANAFEAAGGDSATDPNAAPTVAAAVDYEIKVTSTSGASLCDGDVQLTINTDFSLKFPSAQITCVSLTIDLASVLGGAGGLQSAGSGMTGVSSDGYVLSFASLAGATFSPPRPFLVGPIVQDPSKFQNYNKTFGPIQATASDGTSGSGTFTVNVIETAGSYTNNYLGPNGGFKNVLHWTITTQGFDGMPASDGLLFKKMEWFYNTQPIMIPKIEIVGSIGDLIKSTGSGDAASANALVGELTIDLIAKGYNFGGTTVGGNLGTGTATSAAASPAPAPASAPASSP